jgi:hypothetical protein
MQKNTDIAKKTMDILIATERVADKIIANKQEIIALDRRRQETREAIRNLSKSEGQDKTWITLGSMLVKMKREKAQGIMNKGARAPRLFFFQSIREVIFFFRLS